MTERAKAGQASDLRRRTYRMSATVFLLLLSGGYLVTQDATATVAVAGMLCVALAVAFASGADTGVLARPRSRRARVVGGAATAAVLCAIFGLLASSASNTVGTVVLAVAFAFAFIGAALSLIWT